MLLLLSGASGLMAQVPGGTSDPVVTVPQRTDVYLQYGHSAFRDDTRAWHFASAGLGHRGSAGTYVARLNYARRFSEDGLQVEADAFPRLSASTYGYLNAGYGFSGSFPEWRFGAELYTALPGAWEVSAGVRELRFTERNVTLITGSVGHYFGNAFVSLRPWVQPRSEGTTTSATVIARQYFADADNFVGVRVGYGGTAPEQVTLDVLDRTNAFQAALEGSHALTGRILGTWSAGYEREELALQRVRERVEVMVGLRVGL